MFKRFLVVQGFSFVVAELELRLKLGELDPRDGTSCDLLKGTEKSMQFMQCQDS